MSSRAPRVLSSVLSAILLNPASCEISLVVAQSWTQNHNVVKVIFVFLLAGRAFCESFQNQSSQRKSPYEVQRRTYLLHLEECSIF